VKKFFLISQVFYPDEVSSAHLFTILCKHLAKENIKVEVWAAQPSYTRSDMQPSHLIYHSINIRYLRSTRFHKSNLSGRALNILSFIISTASRLLFSKDKSPVFTHTTPPFLGIVVSMICRIKKRKFIYIMLDIFPEGLIRLGKISRNNPITKIWKGMFIRSLKRSNKILVLGRDMEDYIESIYTEGKKKIEYIPHWQDEKLIHPIPFNENPFVEEYQMKNKFVIQYSGNMGLWNDMATIGKAAGQSAADVNFVFIGDGIRKTELTEAISDKNSENILYLPFQPGEKLSEALSGCHISLVTLREGLEGMAVPSKIYGILASGIPVIALVPQNSEIAYIVNEEKCGIVINPNDPKELLQAIYMLKSDDNLRREMGLNARKAFDMKYTTGIIAEKYLKIIEEVS